MNVLLQGSVCAPSYSILYSSDISMATSRKFGYADHSTVAVQVEKFEEGERTVEYE